MTRARIPHYHEKDPAWEAVEDGAFHAFQRVLSDESVWHALAYLSHKVAAPDPHRFGYRKAWGEGLGLHVSQQIPAAHLMAFWTTDDGWAHWMAPDTAQPASGHDTLRNIARSARREEAARSIVSDLAALDTRGRPVTAVLELGAHAITIFSSDGWTRMSRRPSGNRLGSGPWPALRPLLQKPASTPHCVEEA